MSQETGLSSDDIVSTLQFYSMLKYWKGKHIVLKRKVSITPIVINDEHGIIMHGVWLICHVIIMLSPCRTCWMNMPRS